MVSPPTPSTPSWGGWQGFSSLHSQAELLVCAMGGGGEDRGGGRALLGCPGGGDTPDRVEGRQPWFHPLRRCGGGGNSSPPPHFCNRVKGRDGAGRCPAAARGRSGLGLCKKRYFGVRGRGGGAGGRSLTIDLSVRKRVCRRVHQSEAAEAADTIPWCRF